jgi:hypothetical protein
MPARFAEEMFVSWSKLRVTPEVLKGSMEIFRGVGSDSGSSSSSSSSSSGSSSDESRAFIVTLDVRVAKSWLDAQSILVALNPCAVVRSIHGVPVIFTPQVLLHKRATPLDVLRVVVVVQRILSLFEGMSEAVTANMVGRQLNQLRRAEWAARYNGRVVATAPASPVTSITTSTVSTVTSAAIATTATTASTVVNTAVSATAAPTATPTPAQWRPSDPRKAHLLPHLGLGSDDLLAMLQDGRSYETDNFQAILSHLQHAGWDTHKFTFGLLRTRVEW